MPAKNSTLKNGPRENVLTIEFYKKIKDKHKLNIDYATFSSIINMSNEEIQTIVADYEGGFKVPENMGYFVVTKYQTDKKSIDWVNTNKLKKKIYLPNLHSFGFIHHIKWFRQGLTVHFGVGDAYKFEPCREMKRRLAKNIKAYKIYHDWVKADFISASKTLKRILNKK